MIKVILLLTMTSLTGLNAPAAMIGGEASEPPGSAETAIMETLEAPRPLSPDEEAVREYFKDVPIMIAVARCESSFRHTNKEGNVLRGLVNNQDVGIMQINEYFHLDKSSQLGINIYDLEGNLEYARYLYEKEGTQPWSASRKCWNA